MIFTVESIYITLTDYWMGRDSKYADECTPAIIGNAKRLLVKINKLLAYASADGITRKKLASGWRPICVNDVTSNAAKLSAHIDGRGGDISDEDRAFAQWCLNNLDLVAECGLYMEDPRWTPTWVHLQDRPPKSGKRVYIPSSAPPKAPALVGQKPIPNTAKI